MSTYKTIAETKNFIILEKYQRFSELNEVPTAYQSEADLEKEFIQDLRNQGYDYEPSIKNHSALLDNLKLQLEELNEVKFSPSEWRRFLEEYLDHPGHSIIEKTRIIHDNYMHDFEFDNGHRQNIYIVDKKNISRNKVQVINQFEQKGTYLNRYDVTILVNGLPMVQVELKKRGVAIREAFNQVHRYSKESFNTENSLFKYLQIFVISNGTDSRYFANTVKRDKNSYDFTMNWAKADNSVIKDLKDFTATFFQKNTILSVLLTYSVFDTSDTLLIMRPYQIAATERILWKIRSAHEAKQFSSVDGGGYIWHTTGSGKTLTSFKSARLATQLEFIDKVFFVVDRKDLDYQTMKEYQRFSPDSVNGSDNTAGLKRNIEKEDNKIIVTTIQKLNNLMKSEANLPIYQKEVVFIFDEAHRSQFGEAQKNLQKKFKKYYQFGFTGTPIFPDNALGAETTSSVFGVQLHSYVITDAIRDEKVLKFKVDYNTVRPKFKQFSLIEKDVEDVGQLSALENRKALLHPSRIKEIVTYILNNFNIKTHRNSSGVRGFNAMLAVSSVEAAKYYYTEIKEQQKHLEKALKVATIFSYAANEEQSSQGEVQDESMDTSAMDKSSKEFLASAVADYNAMFRTNHTIDSNGFQNYYRDLAKRVKEREVDLIIVVGMFLTGFDAPGLNTLFVDKNLRYHGLIQAYSRTNRIYDATKRFGNIITFRDLEKATVDAISLFGDKNKREIILENSYTEYLDGFTDASTGKYKRGYKDVVKDLKKKYPDPSKVTDPSDKKEFVKVFGEYIRIENVLQNYDEFNQLRAFRRIDPEDTKAIEEFKENNNLTDKDISAMKKIDLLADRNVQDYRSLYNDIREWLRQERLNQSPKESTVNWDDVVFEVDLLKSQEIDLDYILQLILEYNRKNNNKAELVEDISRIIRASMGHRAKESLVVDFINETNLDDIQEKEDIIQAFFTYAQVKQKLEVEALIKEENLKEQEAKRYIERSLRREYASENGTELNDILPKMSPLNPQFLTKKETVFAKISAFVDKYKGVGGEL